MREDFRPILGYEGHYEINSEGVVISLRWGKRIVMKPQTTSDGYQRIRLCVKGKQSQRLVHRLVWEAFNGIIPEGFLVLHGANTFRDNCCLENLSVGTYLQNNGNDRRRDGTNTKKLTETQVCYIKKRIRDNEKHSVLARLFDVSRSLISHIGYGRVWSHVA